MVVSSPVAVSEAKELLRMEEQKAGIAMVMSVEDNGGGGHGGGCFTGDVGARVGWVDLIGPTRGGHVLGSLPTVMISIGVSNLDPKNIGLRVGLEEVVGAPLDGGQGMWKLVSDDYFIGVLGHGPR